MGIKNRKREREPVQTENVEGVPAKRRRQLNEDHLKLSKLYEDLAAESDQVRFEAAKQLIVKFSPESEPAAKEVETALTRLIKGLCSQRKAARVGFSLTLTELLRQIFGGVKIEGLDHDVTSIIKMVDEKTEIEGNVPGRARRDHLIGKLFGYKAIMQSSIVIEPELSMECWNKLLDHIYGMARDIPWLREECGMVLVEAVKSLKAQPQFELCAEEAIKRLTPFKLVSTPQGVAVWLTVRASYEKILPDGVWHQKDPLSRKERPRLAKLLKEDFHIDSENAKDEKAIKSAAANPNPTFAWDLVFGEILRRDEDNKGSAKEPPKPEFPQLWIDVVDNNLFSTNSSHERKSWGFKLFSSMITRVPAWAVSALFSPNLMRTVINQSKKDDRFLHTAALAALKSVQSRVEQDSSSALPIVVALTTKHGIAEFDKVTKTKTLEQILIATDDSALKKIVRHLKSVILRPDTEEQGIADSRRQTIADLLISTVKLFKRYDKLSGDVFEGDNWLRGILELLAEHAYFTPSADVKTSKVPLPPISEGSRTMFQERLSSCLTRLLGVDVGSRSSFASMIMSIIRSKKASAKTLELVFKAEPKVLDTVEKAFETLEKLSKKKSIAGNKMAAEGFVLLYSLTLLQVYNGDGDAIMMLDDLDASRKAMTKNKDSGEGSDAFVEIVLSFLGNPRTLFRKIGEEAFSIFASEIGSEGLQSLAEILDTEENLEGQKELFNQGDDDAEEAKSDDDSDDDSGMDSDVEMVDSDVELVNGEAENSDDDDASGSDSSSDDSSESDDDEDGEEDDAELTQFNNLLQMTLGTSKANMDGDGDDTSDDSDMDDEQMMALDPQLSKIFKQRSQVTSKKKDREDAKQNVVQFKSRVLDLLAIYLDKQYSNALTLEVLLPVLRRTRASANKQLAEKSAKMLKTYFDTRSKHKAPLPKPEAVETAWAILKGIHEEAKNGGGAKVHADVCSNASLHVVKVLVGLDKANYAGIVDVYAETQKQWFADKKSPLQPSLFTQFQNWSMNAQKQGK
ncbi:DNA-directed DNA polymerase [Ascochyta lentis]